MSSSGIDHKENVSIEETVRGMLLNGRKADVLKTILKSKTNSSEIECVFRGRYYNPSHHK